MQEKNILTPIQYLKGVGPKKADLLSKLGINTIEDLLFYLPRRYENRSKFACIRDVKAGDMVSVKAKITSAGIYMTKKNVPVFQLTLQDGSGGRLYCLWFNMPFMRKNFIVGQTIVVYGKVEIYDKLQMNHPDYEIVQNGKELVSMGRIIPIYSLTQDITQRYLRQLINNAVIYFGVLVTETLPAYLAERINLSDLRSSLANLHFPESFEKLEAAYKRIVFEEFLLLQLALAKRKSVVKDKVNGIQHKLEGEDFETFTKAISFKLTNEQEKVIREVEKDMASGKPMNRLLQGDVGSGKTVVSLYALYLTARNGYQGAIMAPTEVLARQHYMTMSEILMPLGINIRLLISDIPKDKKDEIKQEIANGEVDIVCGTHALLDESVSFKSLGVVVIDEQHKFGVVQRETLKCKGTNPHILIMTATPIPRTLAMTVYGDLDISVIKELPGGRRPISTTWVGEDRRNFVYDFIKDEVKKGRQVFIVYPRIETPMDSEIKSAVSMYTHLQEKVFPELKLALIHGKMQSSEKEEIMKKFKNKTYDILISTTVIEVGIDVPNATVMIIENADKFGLSQLHQLRGRIGRGEHNSYCILMSEDTTENSQRRFSKMVETQDGFEIAEEDLQLRGPGEFLGTRQHGLPELRFGNILKDFEIMEKARKEAFSIASEDPDLSQAKNFLLKHSLLRRFGNISNY